MDRKDSTDHGFDIKASRIKRKVGKKNFEKRGDIHLPKHDPYKRDKNTKYSTDKSTDMFFDEELE